MWIFGSYDKMSNDDRLWFNAILTGLSIVIGLAIASSLNAMTFNIRWWFLSLRKRPLRQVHTSFTYHDLSFMLTCVGRWTLSS